MIVGENDEDIGFALCKSKGIDIEKEEESSEFFHIANFSVKLP
jgi:hypothetical protein